MGKKPKTSTKEVKPSLLRRVLWRPAGIVLVWVLRWAGRITLGFAALVLLAVSLFAWVNPPAGPYMLGQAWRLGGVERDWADFDAIAPAMSRAVVAAEDADFCLHWGLDLSAIRTALADGSGRGGSTISQQVVKNLYLWHGRSWFRKALEALITPVVEIVWSKRRVLEVYLNLAEFDEGIFGVEAAAEHYFGTTAAQLTDLQAARLAAILPDPKGRSASNPSDFVVRRANAILDGAATIRADGRSGCFLPGDAAES